MITIRSLSLLLTVSLLAPVLGAAETKAPETVEAWRARRLAALLEPDGWLTLIGRHPLEHGSWLVGSAENNDIRLAAGPEYLGEIIYTTRGKVLFTVGEDVEATIDGVSRTPANNFEVGGVDFGYEGAWSSGELDYKSDFPTRVRAGSVNFHIIERSGKLFLRVQDTEADRRRNFAGLDSWPENPAWRFEAEWIPYEPPRVMQIANVIGLAEPAKVPGRAVFTHEGKNYSLMPIDEGPESRLFFIFTDTTAGSETYEACRYLYADRPVDGKITLDFNQAYNPPCAFTPFATCPLPPRENFLPFPVSAGEKKYRSGQ